MRAKYGFELVDPTAGPADTGRRDAFVRRATPASLRSHTKGAEQYEPDPPLVTAINTALAVGAPLLLTGEPGTGKTQVAYYLGHYFGVPGHVYPLFVRSTTTASDLEYTFDAVAYFRHDPGRDGDKARGDFVEPGPLWKAYETDGPAVVLLDEIDKAPRDFPNDILNVIDQNKFRVREKEVDDDPDEFWVELEGDRAPPFVVVTSNSERRLPEPFLRRCVFHHIEFTDDLIERAVAAHKQGAFPDLGDDVRKAALARFTELRGRGLTKKPATAELLVWLAVLAARGVKARELEGAALKDLPALGTLLKNRDDLKSL